MFFRNKDQEKLIDAVRFLDRRVDLQADVIEDLTNRLDRYEKILAQATKYGFKKDGSPKAKPGRKVGLI